jgi:Uma2 family endonuclease
LHHPGSEAKRTETMLTTIKETITPEAYLSAERKSETKNEFINGEIIPMSGASLSHNIISSTLSRLLGNQLADKDYIVCQSDMRVHNPLTQSYFYPDVVVIEGEAKLIDNEFGNLLNPVLIIEVLSPAPPGMTEVIKPCTTGIFLL